MTADQARTLRVGVTMYAVSDMPSVPTSVSDDEALTRLRDAFYALLEPDLENGSLTVEARLITDDSDPANSH